MFEIPAIPAHPLPQQFTPVSFARIPGYHHVGKKLIHCAGTQTNILLVDNYNLPYFGQINPAALKGHYRTTNVISGQNIKLDLNFEDLTIDPGKVEVINTFLQNVDEFDKQNKLFIEKDFEEEGEASDYINFYLEEFDEDELSNLRGGKDENKTIATQLLDKLRLVRIGLYPDKQDDAGYFGVFDYSIDIDGEPCNQLLVVVTNETGNLHLITWES